jgi:hypothetical protein
VDGHAWLDAKVKQQLVEITSGPVIVCADAPLIGLLHRRQACGTWKHGNFGIRESCSAGGGWHIVLRAHDL